MSVSESSLNIFFSIPLKGLIDNAQLIPQFFGPDWTMRIYHDKHWRKSSKEEIRFLDGLAENYPHVDLCFIEAIPGFGDLKRNIYKKKNLEQEKSRFLFHLRFGTDDLAFSSIG